MRSRQNSGVPSCAAMSLRPLWPATPPPNFHLRRAGLQVELVVHDQDLLRRDREETGERGRPPGRDRFMNVVRL